MIRKENEEKKEGKKRKEMGSFIVQYESKMMTIRENKK